MSVVCTEGDPPVITVTGEVDIYNLHDLDSALKRAVRAYPSGFVLDFSDLQYIDSAGIASVLSAYQHLRRREGSLALVVTNPNMRDTFYVIRLESLPGISVCEDVESAREAVRSASVRDY